MEGGGAGTGILRGIDKEDLQRIRRWQLKAVGKKWMSMEMYYRTTVSFITDLTH